MTLSSLVKAAAVGATMLWATGAGAATLVGDSVDASVTTFSGSASLGTATVGAGSEFAYNLGQGILGPRSILVDLDATTITLSFSGGGNAALNISPATLSLTNLSFGRGIGSIAFVETPPDPGDFVFPNLFGGNTVTFDATSVTVNLTGNWGGNASLRITLTELPAEEPPVVPLPASAVLLLAGLGGLAALRRRAG